MHRGDTMAKGEGSSGMQLWQNHREDSEIASNLLDKICAALRDKSIVITDGSCAVQSHLALFHRKLNVANSEILAVFSKKEIEFAGFEWKLLCRISDRYGPTLIWGLTRL